MDTKKTALVIVFAAVTVVLNPIAIPAPYFPSFSYRIWDIPIIVAFFLLGFKVAISVAVLNSVAQLFLFPRPIGVIAPLWFLTAVLVLLLGLYSAEKLLERRESQRTTLTDRKPLFYFTALGTAFRAAIMPFVDYYVGLYLLPLVLGYAISSDFLLATTPAVTFFGITQTLYLVPIGYFVAKKVSKTLTVGTNFCSEMPNPEVSN